VGSRPARDVEDGLNADAIASERLSERPHFPVVAYFPSAFIELVVILREQGVWIARHSHGNAAMA